MTLETGTRVGDFEVIHLLGVGGMGEVYRARDLKLGREVAIKVLPAAFASDPVRLARFEREARALASLNHPNIATVYDFENVGDTHFLVMELVEGDTLADRFAVAQPSVAEIVDIFHQIAEGIEAAHEANIVHRDLKPGNIIITRNNGLVKILDFGIAKAIEASATIPNDAPTVELDDSNWAATAEGIVMGTPTYMSPEQARGKAVDRRTDIWAFGCCLFEALSGEKPFHGETPIDTVAAVLHKEPDWALIPRDIPAELHSMMRRCLEKDLRRRLRDIGDIRIRLEDLQADGLHAQRTLAAGLGPRPLTLSLFAPLVFGAVGLAMALLLVLLVSRLGAPTEAERSSIGARLDGPISTLAVLPFRNSTGDESQEYFADGMTEAIIGELARINSIRVVSRTSAMHYRDSQKSPQEIAKELGVEGIIEGSVFRNGDKVRINAQLIHGPTDEHLWAERYEGTFDGLLKLQSEVALDIARHVEAVVTPEEEQRFALADSVDPAAHDAYLRGRYLWNRRTPDAIQQAITYFEQAKRLDPTYAAPYAGLADCYIISVAFRRMPAEEGMPRALAEARRAVQLDPNSAEGHAALAIALMSQPDWRQVFDELERAIALDPGYTAARYYYANALTNSGRIDEALYHATEAVRIDPLSVPANSSLANAYFTRREYTRALAQLEKSLELSPEYELNVFLYAQCLRELGRYDDAIEVAQNLSAASGDKLAALCLLGQCYAAGGRHAEAQTTLAQVLERAPSEYGFEAELAAFYAALGETESAIEWLEKAAVAYRSWGWLYLASPWWDPIRGERGFREVIERHNIPHVELLIGNAGDEGPIQRIAVLPFVNLSGDDTQEYFVDGMTDALTAELSKINALRVISRSSAMTFKNTNKTAKEIGRELQVDAVVEGSVQREGDDVRITAQLIDTRNDEHLWGQNYTRTIEDILALQSEVVMTIAQEIEVSVSPDEQLRIARAVDIDPKAHDAYLRGRFYLNQRTLDGFTQALQNFEEALRIDPNSARALAGIAEANNLMGVYGLRSPSDAYPQAKDFAQRAIAIDDALPEAWAALGVADLVHEWNWAESETALTRALELNPNSASAHLWYAFYLLFTRRFDEALAEIQRATEADPLAPIIKVASATIHYSAREYGEALRLANEALQIVPNLRPALWVKTWSYVETGRTQEALTAAQQLYDAVGSNLTSLVYLGAVTAIAGDTEGARVILDEVLRRQQDEHVSAADIAELYHRLGQDETALDWLEKALEVRDFDAVWLNAHPRWDALRDEPRFQALLTTVGFPSRGE